MGKKKSDDIFYGLILNEDQEKFKEALMDDNIQVVLCDATAGSGIILLLAKYFDLCTCYRQ